MGKKKKAFEINFGTLLLIIIGICCIIFAFKNFSKEKTKAENNQNENITLGGKLKTWIKNKQKKE